MIDGTLERDCPQLLHSSSNSDVPNPRDRLARLLTSGLNARRYNFRVWNRENDKSWNSVRYEQEDRGDYTKSWNYHSLMDVPFALICQDNENIRNFSRELNRMERPKTVPRLTACPQVSVKIGDLKITLNLGGRRLEFNLELINKCSNHEQLVDFSRRASIWRVSYRNNPMDDEYPKKKPSVGFLLFHW